MKKKTIGTTPLAEWLNQPPTIVIYRPDGELSLDQLPNMGWPDAVMCFRSMRDAKRFVKVGGKMLKKWRAVRLSIDEWLETIKNETEKGRTHLSIWDFPDDKSERKSGLRIDDVLKSFELAVLVMQEKTEEWLSTN